jgi:hypothetical protein
MAATDNIDRPALKVGLISAALIGKADESVRLFKN